MNKRNAEANALRTLEARRAAQDAANAPREIRPVPSGPLQSNNPDQRYGQNSSQNSNQNNGQYERRSANNGQYGGTPPGQYGGAVPAPQMPQNSGLMNVITGFLLAKAVTPSHAGNNGHYGGNSNNNSNNTGVSSGNDAGNSMGNSGMATAAGANAIPVQSEPKSSFLMSVLRTMAWLAIVTVIAWLVYFGWKFLRRGKAPSTSNYSFERN